MSTAGSRIPSFALLTDREGYSGTAMSNNIGRWGFEEADDGILIPARRPASPPRGNDGDGLIGQDRDEVITISVTESGDVLSVRLAGDWRRKVDPRALHSSVLDAMKAATMRAFAARSERTGAPSRDFGAGTQQARSEGGRDEENITTADMVRLLAAARAELRQYARQRFETMRRLVTVDSPGGNVRVHGKAGRVTEVALTVNWVTRVRVSEVEAELLAALRSFIAKSAVDDTSAGLDAPALDELMSLAPSWQASRQRVSE